MTVLVERRKAWSRIVGVERREARFPDRKGKRRASQVRRAASPAAR